MSLFNKCYRPAVQNFRLKHAVKAFDDFKNKQKSV